VETFTYISSEVNDGGWKQSSAEDRALNRAKVAFHAQGGWDWSAILIEKLPCDNRDKTDPNSHYPNLCWHYEITIEPKEDE
jgi:hypothetical protein